MQNLSLPELKNTATNYEKLMVPALFVNWSRGRLKIKIKKRG